MALIISDRVKETTTTSGTGTISLGGAVGGFVSFDSAISEGNTTYYVIENDTRWEIGIGTYSSGSLSRDTVLSSSIGGGKISLSGVSFVFVALPSSKTIFKDEDGSFNLDADISTDNITVEKYSLLNDVATTGDIISSGLLTLVRTSSGNFFQAYVDDSNKRTLSLHTNASAAPQWKLGLKSNPNDPTSPPTYAYIQAEDGDIGLYGNSSNYLSLSHGAGFTVVNKSDTIFTTASTTGTSIFGNTAAYPTLIVKAAVSQAANIQEWKNSADSILVKIENDGSLVVNGSDIVTDIRTNSSSGVSISGYFETGGAVSGYLQGVIDAIPDAAAVSGYLEPKITANASDIATVSGLLGNSEVADFASGLAVTNAADIVTVSGLLDSAGSTSGIVFEPSGTNSEFRIGTVFIDADGTEQVVRATDFNGGFLRLEIARFSPSVSAAGQSRSWDQPVSQWSVTVDNPTDFTTNYVSGVKSPLTGITGSVTSGVTLYSTSGPSVTPGGGIDWTQTFSTDGDSPIYSSTNDLTGGSASATVSFLDKNQATISETATITFNWSTASNAISFGNLSGKNFLETYTSTTYNLTINNISDLSNTSTTITSSQGSLSNSSDDGTITFTTAIHKDNNSGRTITATTDFTRPATVTGTEYTSQDVSSDSSISASFTYPSFYIFTASTSNVPSRADIVDTNDFDSSTVTELGNQAKTINQYINNPDGVPKCWWFGVRSSASQPTSFETGSGPSLLVGATPTEATVDLEPDSPPAGYNAEEYKLYGITLNPGNTYVKIS